MTTTAALTDVKAALTQVVLTETARDPAFRAALLRNPEAAIRKHLGLEAPLPMSVRVIEEQAGEVILALPVAEADRLSDRQLDTVAGGRGVSDNLTSLLTILNGFSGGR